MKSPQRKTFTAMLIFILLLLASVSPTYALPANTGGSLVEMDEVVDNGFAYLATQMNPDGGFRWLDESSSVAVTIRVVQALAAAGVEQDFLMSETGSQPVDFLTSSAEDWVYQVGTDTPGFSVARAGQMLTAIAAANENPHAFGPDATDLIHAVQASYDPNTGIYGGATSENVIDQVWAMLGLSANAIASPVEASDWLASAQLPDGSWDDGFGSYLDTTPLALMALLASGERTADSAESQAAIEFMISNQQPEGGWQSSWDTTTNADTTAAMLQAISALGQLPTDDNWQNVSGNPHQALLALQQDSGAIGGDYANAYSTADAIVGLSGQPLFDLGYLQQASQSFAFLFEQQQADGGWNSMGQTIDAILALQAAGWDPATVTEGDTSPQAYFEANLAEYLTAGPDAIGKSILGAVALGAIPTDFAGTDLVTALMATYDETAGAFGTPDNTWHQALAILGLKAADAEIPAAAVETLLGLQQDDGGWEYTPGFGTWPDNTALAMQALMAAGAPNNDPAMLNALQYIEDMQVSSGDWGDSSTTSYVLMALNALEIEPDHWNTMATSPLSALFSYQKDNGAFVYNWEYSDDNLLSTTAALLATFGGDYLVTAPEGGATHYAGLVVDPGDNDQVTTVCVPFEEDIFSGMDLLVASGLELDAPEGFINSIMGIANPEGDTLYWSYWYFDGREWNFHNTGAAESVIQPSSVEAWYLTSWEVFPSLPPEGIPDLSAICELDVLKDYTVQPYLNYTDLPASITGPMAAQPVQPETPPAEPTTEAAVTEEAIQPTPTEQPTVAAIEEAETDNSATPILLILGIGAILIVIIVVVTKKSKQK